MYKVESVRDISINMLDNFDRRQVVTQRYDLTDNIKSIQPISFVDDWSENTKHEIVKKFFMSEDYYNSGVYDKGKLVAFTSLYLYPIGPEQEYLEMKMLHVDKAFRGKGLGKLLFADAAQKAKALKAKKLYISAHSAVETQEFYMALGCVDTTWISPKAFEEEPYDIHMEYRLV